METATLNLLIGGAIAIVSSIVTALVSSRLAAEREERAERRKTHMESTSRLEALYIEVLNHISGIIAMHPLFWDGTFSDFWKELGAEQVAYLTKLELLSTDSIFSQYGKLLSDIQRIIQVKASAKHGSDDSKVDEIDTTDLYSKMVDTQRQLTRLMREHLDSLRNERM
jgi:hypothetical protein